MLSDYIEERYGGRIRKLEEQHLKDEKKLKGIQEERQKDKKKIKEKDVTIQNLDKRIQKLEEILKVHGIKFD